jgi:hypothetical protein
MCNWESLRSENGAELESFYAQMLRTLSYECNIQKPFFHLQNDQFGGEPLWYVVTYSGKILRQPIYGKKAFFETVQYGQLHPTVNILFNNPEHRRMIKKIIIDLYFPH